MKKHNNFGRMLWYEAKSNARKYALFMVELVLCISLATLAIMGAISLAKVKQAYDVYGDAVSIESSTRYDDYEVEIERFKRENEVGYIGFMSIKDYESYEFMQDPDILLYNRPMAKNVPIPLSKGSGFTDNYTDEYFEIILDPIYKKEFKLGQIINDDQIIHIFSGQQRAKFKVVGFMEKNTVFWYMSNGVVKNVHAVINDYNSEQNKLSLTYAKVFNDFNPKDYNFDLEVKKISQIYYDSFLELHGSGDMQFFDMFIIIAAIILISSLLSYSVAKYNYSLQKYSLCIKMGQTIQSMLLIRIIVALVVLGISAIFSYFLFSRLHIYFAEDMDWLLFSSSYFIGAIFAVGVPFLAIDMLSVGAIVRNIKKEKT